MMKFIVIEGPDGVGKTTQCQLVKHALETLAGKRVFLTREPFAYEKLIKDKSGTPLEIAERFVADRIAHCRHMNVECATNIVAGTPYDYVICDRYALSTLIYQSDIGKVPLNAILELHSDDETIWVPDLQIVLFTEKDLHTRVKDRGDEEYAFAGAASAVKRAYRRYAGVNTFPLEAVHGLHVIFGTQNVGISADDSIEDVTENILKKINTL